MGNGDEPQMVMALRAAMLAAVEGGRSLRDLARAAELHADTVCQFVKGERDIKLAGAGRIAVVLGLELVAVKVKKAAGATPHGARKKRPGVTS